MIKVILNDTLEKRGKTQYWLAKKTGIAQSTLSNLCANKTSKIDFLVLQKICNALDCDVTDIISVKESDDK